ncbi:NADH:ubiquinone oxidoreductase subunit NDUFA12 [Pontivivens insulae]|uniref:NADH dehydrogenase n=1 Tax=Pontivivens insulae TaxID=1639689 RepID=A0A2R8AB56_9RHOB|nr:NADH:ubiquinone oxidoreductase subunit NDUFA12 [Pontivivens insulae]RED11361.1 NADH:ubiquinone oxidoreductase subunit [Pontivivens insulae]SPF29466.1 hypothetical protein POI8812_01776 [Pontivivens insulae]
MNPILRLLTWWNGSTLNTALWSRRNGQKVGEDAQGNVYMQTSDGARRWVMYNGDMEASRVSPEWHGWLHHTFDQPPTEAPLPRKDWEKPHLENMTGTALAYRPPGSILTPETRPQRRGDYEAWQPE